MRCTCVYLPYLDGKTYSDVHDGPSSKQERKPDPESLAANENSDIEADREPVKPPGHLPVPESPRNTRGLTRQRVVRGGMPPRAVSTESDDVEYLTPEMVRTRHPGLQSHAENWQDFFPYVWPV